MARLVLVADDNAVDKVLMVVEDAIEDTEILSTASEHAEGFRDPELLHDIDLHADDDAIGRALKRFVKDMGKERPFVG